MKIQKKIGGGGEGLGGKGQGGCERRIEVFCENCYLFFFWGGGRVGGVRVDVNGEMRGRGVGGRALGGGGSGWM